MIKREYQESELHFTPEVNEFIPTSWQLIDMVVRSIARGEYNRFHKQVVPVDDDGVVLGNRLLEVDFREATVKLFEEACQRCSRTLPTKIYDLREPQKVLDALLILAQDIIDEYRVARPFLKVSEEFEVFDIIKDNCELVIDILKSKPDIGEYSHKHGDFSFFSPLSLRSWHRIVNGRCIEKIEYDIFSRVLNCSESLNYTIDGDIIQEENNGVHFITPVPNMGMALYVFLLLLMTRRWTFNQPEYPDEDVQGDNKYWARQFASRVNWREDRYYIIDDFWKEAYVCDGGSIDAPQQVSVRDKKFVQDFLKRKVFDDIYSNGNLDTIVDNYPGDVSFAQLQFIHASSMEELTMLYDLLTKETRYLYDNIKSISGHFLEKSHAESNRDETEGECKDKERNNKYIEHQFSHVEDLDFKTVHRLFFYNSLFTDVYSWQQKFIYSELVKKYLEQCLVQNEKLRVLLSLYINGSATSRDEQSTTESSKVVIPFTGKLEEYEDMSEYLRPDGTIIGKKSVFVRALVKKGHVMADNDWKSIFSHPRRKELYSPESSLKVDSEELLELTRTLRWKKFDRLFIYKGTRQSYKQLQQAFSDGDIDGHQRVEAIKTLYMLVNQQS